MSMGKACLQPARYRPVLQPARQNSRRSWPAASWPSISSSAPFDAAERTSSAIQRPGRRTSVQHPCSPARAAARPAALTAGEPAALYALFRNPHPSRPSCTCAGLRLGVYQRGAGLLCAGRQQGSLEIQRLARAEYGGTMAANNGWAQGSSDQAGLAPVGGPLSFRRIIDVPFQTWVAALDGWQRTGHRDLLVGDSLLRGPASQDRETGTRRIQVR